MADEKYWMYQSSFPTPSFDELPKGCFKGTEAQWFQLSPGMRREILRDFNRRQKIQYSALVMKTFDAFEHADRREFLEKKAAVERAARQRL